jgi:hypothetical protein
MFCVFTQEMKNTEHRMKNDKVAGILDWGNQNIAFKIK